MKKRTLLTLLSVLLLSILSQLRPLAATTKPFTYADRIACRQSIEQIYWERRIWPAENDGPHPSLDELLPVTDIEQQVDDMLRQSTALAQFWGEPITPERLQAEIERMAAHSQQPDTLADLWRALENDPYLIAECLARPQLVNRLLTNRYATDEQLHGALRAQAEKELAQLDSPEQLSALTGTYQEATWVVASANSHLAPGVIALDADQWDERQEEIVQLFDAAALPLHQISPLQEDSSRFYAVTVLENSTTTLRLGVISWAKQPLESWWAAVREQYAVAAADTAFTYQLPVIERGRGNETWTPTQALLDPRYEHGAAWTGNEMIVWGGMSVVGRYFHDGGRYNPATDTWTTMSTVNAPVAGITPATVWTGTELLVWGTAAVGSRYNPTTDSWTPMTAVNAPGPRAYFAYAWSGTELIIWGGVNPSPLGTGGRYNPTSDTWTILPSSGAPSARGYLKGVWTGNDFIVWGGYTGSQMYNNGARYNPTSNTWAPLNQSGAPTARYFHTAVWSGTEMIIWGGSFSDNSGGRYNPVTNSWTPTNQAAAPTLNWLHTAVWTGSEMIVFGGSLATPGGRYSPTTDTWMTLNTINAPEKREGHTAVWTGSEMVVWGGWGDGHFINNGGRYHPPTNTWLTINNLNVPQARYNHASIWTGAELIVWGGWNNPYPQDGGRYDPITDSWQSTSLVNVPAGRERPTEVWTGTEMIVWGGTPETLPGTGGRYNPVTNSWITVTTAGAPDGRYGHSAVWSGTQMIIWGGYTPGGRYNPATNSWTTITSVNEPNTRTEHVAVWTGSEMIIWGGDIVSMPYNDGGRYNPSNDTWTATSLINTPQPRQRGADAVWTGTEMIVWGGCVEYGCTTLLNDGGRYNPATNTWTATSMNGVPSPRSTNLAWTGVEMVAWGGRGITGGLYNPQTNSWRTMNTVNAPFDRNDHTAIWTGQEFIVWGGGPVETVTGGRYGIQYNNNWPNAVPDAYSTAQGTPLVISSPGVLANDNDPDNDPLTAVLVTTSIHGSLHLQADGGFTYTPHAGYHGNDSFVYRAYDGQAYSSFTSVQLTVTPVTNRQLFLPLVRQP